MGVASAPAANGAASGGRGAAARAHRAKANRKLTRNESRYHSGKFTSTGRGKFIPLDVWALWPHCLHASIVLSFALLFKL